MTAPEVRHPIFARVFDRLCPMLEREAGRHRAELVAGLTGRVVEIGAGNGANFKHYPVTVDEVVASEPESYLRGKAQHAARCAAVPVSVGEDPADALQLADAAFDAAVVSLVLCTVPNPSGALAQLRRVLKPGGELRFFEHVRSEHPRQARRQQRLDRTGLWPRLAGGCHCARDTVTAIEVAGFDIEHVRKVDIGPSSMHTNPHVIGVARRPVEPVSHSGTGHFEDHEP